MTSINTKQNIGNYLNIGYFNILVYSNIPTHYFICGCKHVVGVIFPGGIVGIDSYLYNNKYVFDTDKCNLIAPRIIFNNH